MMATIIHSALLAGLTKEEFWVRDADQLAQPRGYYYPSEVVRKGGCGDDHARDRSHTRIRTQQAAMLHNVMYLYKRRN
jgi:hypothetical protein